MGATTSRETVEVGRCRVAGVIEAETVEVIAVSGFDETIARPLVYRGAAGAEDIPLLTTASAALAAAKGLHEWKNSSLEVRTLQTYHEGVKAEH